MQRNDPAAPSPRSPRKRGFNLYISPVNFAQGSRVARARYDVSISRLVDELLAREIATKGGLLHARLATR